MVDAHIMKARGQILLSFLSGLLVCLSFPTLIAGVHLPEMGWLAWVALVPLLVAVRKASPRRAFLLTMLSGLVWYAGSIFWVYRAMHTYGHLPPLVSGLVLALLVLVLSAFIGLGPLLARLIQTRWQGPFIAWLPLCWTGVEYLRNLGPCNGFPWSNLAMSQWRFLPLIQIADLVGVYGVIFLVVLVNAFLAELAARLSGEAVRSLAIKGMATAAIFMAALGYGWWRLVSVPQELASNPSASVGLIQGNIEQGDKWEKALAEANLAVHRARAGRLAESGVELIVWPEASFPWFIGTSDHAIDPRVLGLPAQGLGDVPFTLLGALSETPDRNYYNSAVLFDAGGRIAGRYHKAHLVPFGEYVPYQKLLFFARKLTQPAGNFLAGTSFEPLLAGRARLGLLICYEDIFPEIARASVREGAELLVNITNDAWYGVSSAPYQHLALAVFRAVENRRFLLRATNSGVSAVVMPTGEVMVESGIFEPALIVSPVVLLRGLSPYTMLGDWFARGCLASALLGLLAGCWRMRPRSG